jgi:methyltransferase (TIGR00027 family)
MDDERAPDPDSTAVSVALWRAMHVERDPPPHVLQDEIGLRLAAPDESWRRRPDMEPLASSRARATIVARTRFIEDLVIEQADCGVSQYIILGAGLDTFAQRRPEAASRMRVFEVDQPGTQAWKRQRLIELGFAIPEWLRLVPADLEANGSWWERLVAADFNAGQPAVVAAAGVSMYLSKTALATTLRQIASLAPGSTLAITFMLPLELIEPEERVLRHVREQCARTAGTPLISFYTPAEMQTLAREAGFGEIQHIPANDLAGRYFAGRTDGLRPSSSGELMVASTKR